MQQPPQQQLKADTASKPPVSSAHAPPPRPPPPRPPPPVHSRAEGGGSANVQDTQSETKEGCVKVGVAPEGRGDGRSEEGNEDTDAGQPSSKGEDQMAASESASASNTVDDSCPATSTTQSPVSKASAGNVERIQVQSKPKKSMFGRRPKPSKSPKSLHEDPRGYSPPVTPDKGSSKAQKPTSRGKSFRKVMKKLDLHRGNGSKVTSRREETDSGVEPNASEGEGSEQPDLGTATMTSQAVATTAIAAATPGTPTTVKVLQVSSNQLDPLNSSTQPSDAVKQEKQESDAAVVKPPADQQTAQPAEESNTTGNSSPKKRIQPSTTQPPPQGSPPSPKAGVQQSTAQPLEGRPPSPKKRIQQPVARPQESNSTSPKGKGRVNPPPGSQSVAPREEEVFPINRIHLCVNGRWLCVSNTGGSVLAFNFEPFSSHEADASSVSRAEMDGRGREGRKGGGWWMGGGVCVRNI